MMAGGYNLFSSGNILSAATIDSYLMNQSVMVFASAAARTAALAGVITEGMVTYRTDSHILEYYNGSAWTAVAISPFPTINTQTGTSFTFALSDATSIVTFNNASAISVTIPTNASVAFAVGTQLNFVWITGAGQPTISGAGGVTIISTGAAPTSPHLRAVNSMATAMQIAANTWLVVGDIS